MINILSQKYGGFFMSLIMSSGIFLLADHPGVCIGGMVADSILEEARQKYDTGSHEQAIHLFSKVLLIDPRNQEALDYLKKMGLDGGIYGYQKTAADHVYDLMDEISLYRNQLQALEDRSDQQTQETDRLSEQKKYLEDLIERKEQERQQLMQQKDEIFMVSTMKLKEQQEQLLDLQQQAARKTDELVRLNTDLFELKKKWQTDQAALGNTTEQLHTVTTDLKEHQDLNAQQRHEMKLKYEHEIADLEQRRDALESDIFNLTQEHQQRAARLQGIVQQRDAELTLERGRLAVTAYQLAEKEGRILKMQEDQRALRLQRDALEKEAQALRDNIQQMNQDKTFRYAQASPTDEQRKKLIAHIYKQDDQIIDLKSRLTDLRQQMTMLKNEESEKDRQRAMMLEQQIASLQNEIRDKERTTVFLKEQRDSLEGRVKDYQERLDIVEGMIQDKEERILFLEEQLGSDVYLEKE